MEVLLYKLLKKITPGFILVQNNRISSSFNIPEKILSEVSEFIERDELNCKEVIDIMNFRFDIIHENNLVVLIKHESNEEHFYKEIFESAVLGIYRSTPGKGKHLTVNPELVKIYGYDNEEDLIKGISSIKDDLFVSSDRRDELLKILKEKGKCSGFESEVKKKNGEKIWISENARAVFNSKGQIETIIGTVKDITERKEIENKLRLINRDWERTFNSIEESIIIINTENKVSRINSSCKHLGINPGDRIDELCLNIFNCVEKECNSCVIKNSNKFKKVVTKEVYNTLSGKYFNISSTPVYDSGKYEGTVLIVKDVTELKLLEEESKIRLQELIHSDKLKSLGEMVANVAHEINNPNSYINYNSEELEHYWKIFKPYLVESFSEFDETIRDKMLSDLEFFEESITSIQKGSKRIAGIIDTLKNYVRTDNMNKEFFEPNSKIEQAVQIINPNLKKSGCILRNKYLSKSNIEGYPTQFEQVIVNILMNSIKALSGKTTKEISIITEDFKDGVLISITDTGKGIDPEDLNKIFEPFYSTYRNEGGTGLGLSISYQILKKHGATINLISIKDIGTSVKLFFGKKNYRRKVCFICNTEEDREKLQKLNNVLIDFDFRIAPRIEEKDLTENTNLIFSNGRSVGFPFTLNYKIEGDDLIIDDGTKVAMFFHKDNYSGLNKLINEITRVVS